MCYNTFKNDFITKAENEAKRESAFYQNVRKYLYQSVSAPVK